MTHASVFSGIGGPEVAAAMLGWENVFHCEINPFGRSILKYWFPESKSYEDITKTDFSEWRGKIDVLTGGFPCQPFSYAGQRRGAEDDRYLWPSMFRCIDEVQPTWVIAENVAGITTMVEQGEVVGVAAQASLFDEDNDIRRYELRETFTLERICNDLKQHGYDVQPILIPACSVGAPHRRDRVFIVARRIASDSDSRADRRTAREDEGKGREERIQERHEVRKPDEPNQVRPEGGIIDKAGYEEPTKGGRPSANTEGNGDSRRPRQVCGEERRPAELNAESCINGEVRAAADTDGCGSVSPRPSETSEGNGIGQLSQSDGQGIGCASSGHSRLSGLLRPTAEDVINSERIRRVARSNDDGFSETSQQGERGELELGGADCPQNWWRGFPSISPVHRGNDGLPFNVDDLTISFGKWRTESLKAYGNAIVPQVMYEIFRAIDEITRPREN